MKGTSYLILLIMVVGLSGSLLAQTNILPNGDFEIYEPGFWAKLNDGMGGAQCSWVDDESAGTGLRSLKVDKSSSTTEAVGWKSDNNADLYWNDAAGNASYTLRFWAKTAGVNTSPANDDARIGVWYRFYEGGNLIGEQLVAVDQTAGSVDWTEYVSALLVTGTPDEIYAEAVMGKDATGTVWFDNIDCGTAEWSMGIFNGDAETPVGWLFWTDGANGLATVVSDTVHDGNHGVLLYEKDTADDEMVFYSIPYPATADKWYKVSVWIKTDSINTDPLAYPTNVMTDRDNDRIGITFIWHTTADPDVWSETAGDHFFYIDQRDSASDWTQYSVVAQAPAEAGGIAIRARFTSFPTGYAWYDDFSIEEMEDMPDFLLNGDLETYFPGFWSTVNNGVGGALCTWADDASAGTGLRSLKIEKPAATAEAISWYSANNADLYWNDAAGNASYTLRFWAKTTGVNTSPANDDARIGVWYRFYEGGNLIGEQLVAVDQTAGSVDWTEYVSALLITGTPDEIYAEAVMGKDATGTVWFDNIDCGTAEWSMGIFNGDAETPVGWLYWTDGANGLATVVSDTVHDGNYGVLMYEKDTADDEMVFYSIPNPAIAEKWYKFSVWIKTDSINTDPLAYPTNVMTDRDNDRIGITFIWHTTADPDVWSETAGDHFFYIDQRNPESDWTQYSVIAQAPAEAGGIAIRARFTSFPTGYAWYDDFSIEEVSLVVVSIEDPATNQTTLLSTYELMQNYPNPFNPETIIEYQVPERGKVELNIYNMIGQKIRTLVDQELPIGTYHVMWDGKDDFGRIVATGIYLYQLRGTNALITKKMTFVK
jgi:hypothetical protein